MGSPLIFQNQPCRVGLVTRVEWENLTDARVSAH